MSTIAVSHVSKRFGVTLALDDVSFEVGAGHITGFLGPNGAGKTTCMRVLLDLVQADAGSATINGRRYADLEDPIRSVGAMLEASGFHPGRTGLAHLESIGTVVGIRRARAEEVLNTVGLGAAADKKVKTYSLGMRQRLQLAAALLGDPPVLLLDEPANGLDPDGMRWLRNFLREQAEAGRTILISSHVLAEIAQTVDDVLILSRGRLITHEPIDDLVRRATHGVRVRTPNVRKLARLLSARGVESEREGEQTLVVASGDSELIGTLAAENKVPILELARTGGNLEDVFIELTSRQAVTS